MAHKAIIARVDEVRQIPGAERIQVAVVLGETVIVSKDIHVGFEGILFPVDLQLSEQYAHENNLFRHSELNKDPTKTGFFDDNRRVRAQPFMKVRSTGYFTTKESVEFTGVDSNELTIGYQFNDLNGINICNRYESEIAKKKRANIANSKAKKQNLVPLFLKHKDSEQLRHYIDTIPTGALLSFHAKAHGTSFRVGRLPVIQQLSWWKQQINKILPVFQESEMQLVVGTRNVILQTPKKEGFHGSESFRFDVAQQLAEHIPPGMTMYGEIIGFVNGKPIMPSHSIKALKDKTYLAKYGENITYSYNCSQAEFKFFVYRITITGMDGEQYEFSQQQLEAYCDARGIERTLDVHPPIIYDGNVEKLKQLTEELTERLDVLTEDYRDPSHVSEGIILRVDYKNRTDFYKNKSTAFRIMEGILEAPDIEELS